MDRSYTDLCRAVAEVLVDGYRPYLERMLRERGVEPGTVEAAITSGQTALAADLAAWADQPAPRQRTVPMQLFREALADPTTALADLGVVPVARDEPSRRSLPGDLFDLAPASARELGEAAWEVVSAWGIARAKVIGGMVPATGAPTIGVVALVGSELVDRSKVMAAAEAVGRDLVVWRNPAAVESGLSTATPDLALVDLGHPAAIDAVTRLSAAGVRVVAFGPHVDTDALQAAIDAGAAEALPRSRFFSRLPELLG